MRNMIDKRGKIFGIINVIDLLFLLILGVALVGGFIRFKDSTIVAESTSPGKISILVDDVREASIENIKEGQDLYHYDKGIHLGKITAVEVSPYKKPVEFEGEWVDAEVPGKYSALITLEVEVTQNEKAYMIGGEEMRVGTEYRLKSKTSAFTGVCVGIYVED